MSSGLRPHPALLAWERLGNHPATDVSVEVVSQKEKASVYRLRGAGPGGSDVIAKQCSPENAAVETKVYQELLPSLPVTRVELLGSTADDGAVWMFLMDAPGEKFSHADPIHCAAVSSWIAEVHTGADGHDLLNTLPDRDAEYFIGRLKLARWQIRRRLEIESLDDNARKVLTDVVRQCDELERRWDDLAEACAALPATLVHGDFSALNIRVALTSDGPTVYAFDWEKSGRGPVAVDFVRGLMPERYHAVAVRQWPQLTVQDVDRMAAFGRILRPLTHNWSKKKVEKIEDYYFHMNNAMRTVGWIS
jgi:aminoglycoside phosphotransferase (APT) family kinase protein